MHIADDDVLMMMSVSDSTLKSEGLPNDCLPTRFDVPGGGVLSLREL